MYIYRLLYYVVIYNTMLLLFAYHSRSCVLTPKIGHRIVALLIETGVDTMIVQYYLLIARYTLSLLISPIIKQWVVLEQ